MKMENKRNKLQLLALFVLTMAVSLTTGNVRGILSSYLCLFNVLNNSRCDIAVLCQHHLQSNNSDSVDTLHNDNLFVHKGGIDFSVAKAVLL